MSGPFVKRVRLLNYKSIARCDLELRLRRWLPCDPGPFAPGTGGEGEAKPPIEVALARREFESWFVASAESLQGVRGLAGDLIAPPDVESIRGAKEWLRKRMVPGRGYSAVIDQPALAAKFDMDMAERRSDSFASCKHASFGC